MVEIVGYCRSSTGSALSSFTGFPLFVLSLIAFVWKQSGGIDCDLLKWLSAVDRDHLYDPTVPSQHWRKLPFKAFYPFISLRSEVDVV